MKTFDRRVHDSWEGSIDAEKKKGKERKVEEEVKELEVGVEEEVEEEVKEVEEGKWDGEGEGG